MTPARSALLAAVPGAQRALQRLAVAAALTVDDIVCALLGRVAAPPALAAAERFAQQFPGAKVALSRWPWTCPQCRRDVAALASCTGQCGLRLCAPCGAPGACQRCVDQSEVARANALRDAAAQDAAVKAARAAAMEEE